jgi:hypothetical protein
MRLIILSTPENTNDEIMELVDELERKLVSLAIYLPSPNEKYLLNFTNCSSQIV